MTRLRLKFGYDPEVYYAGPGRTFFRHARYIANAKTKLAEVVSEQPTTAAKTPAPSRRNPETVKPAAPRPFRS